MVYAAQLLAAPTDAAQLLASPAAAGQFVAAPAAAFQLLAAPTAAAQLLDAEAQLLFAAAQLPAAAAQLLAAEAAVARLLDVPAAVAQLLAAPAQILAEVAVVDAAGAVHLCSVALQTFAVRTAADGAAHAPASVCDTHAFVVRGWPGVAEALSQVREGCLLVVVIHVAMILHPAAWQANGGDR